MNLFISPLIKNLISLAIDEDIINNDMTSLFSIDENSTSSAEIIAKEDMIFCGNAIVGAVIEQIDKNIRYKSFVYDGESIKKGRVCLSFEGNSKSILMMERILLNFLQRMSGIASKTNSFVKALNNENIRIVDTRKTLPGFRAIDKYSVRMGGGFNHRLGLSDGILIKENHIKSSGSIKNAVTKLRKNIPHTMKIECEVTNLAEVKEALESGVDIIMLDNMNIVQMQEAIEVIRKYKGVLIEISGNVTEERLASLSKLDIDIISSGALTHSVKACDLSMKFR